MPDEEAEEQRKLDAKRYEEKREKIRNITLTTTDYVPNRNVTYIFGIVESSDYSRLADEAYERYPSTDAVISITVTKTDTIDGLESCYIGTAVELD